MDHSNQKLRTTPNLLRTGLVIINLSGNPLTAIDLKILPGTCKTLILNKCTLLCSTISKEMTNCIIDLRLDTCDITAIDLRNFPQLKELHLEDNCISDMNAIIFFTDCLRKLFLAHNFIKVFPAHDHVFQTVRHLDLSSNKLTHCDFIPLRNLRHLDVSDNTIQVLILPASLQTLDCSNNLLTEIPISINLEEIDVSANNLKSNISINPFKLIRLDMGSQHYNVENIRIISSSTTVLQYLDISDNGVVTVTGLPSTLEILVAENNRLHSIKLPESLIEVYLGDNYLEEVPVLPSTIKKAYFADNRIDTAPLGFPVSLEEFDIRKNPLVITPVLRAIPILYSNESDKVPQHELKQKEQKHQQQVQENQFAEETDDYDGFYQTRQLTPSLDRPINYPSLPHYNRLNWWYNNDVVKRGDPNHISAIYENTVVTV